MDSILTYSMHAARRSHSLDAVIDLIADEVLSDGNVERALQRAFRFGTEEEMGLLDVLDRLRHDVQEVEPTLQTADQHASEMALVQAERRHEDSIAIREALRQVESLDDLQGIDPQLMQRTLTSDELEWVEKWAEMTGQLIESGLVISIGNRLELTRKAISRIGSRLIKHMFLPPKVRGRGDHLLHRSGTAAMSDDVIPWEWGMPFDLHITRSLANALRNQHPSGSISLAIDDFEVFDRQSGAAVTTALLIDMSRSMFESGAWDAAKRAAIALDSLHATGQAQDTLVLIGFSGDARKLNIAELPMLNWDQFSHGTNLQAGLVAAAREMNRYHGNNRQIVIITDGEPTAYLDGQTPIFEHPVTNRTIEATLREARRLARKNVAMTMIRVKDDNTATGFAEQFVRATSGRLIDVPLDSLGAFVVRDIARGSHRTIR